MAREDAKNTWADGLLDYLERFFARHSEIKPYIRPRRSVQKQKFLDASLPPAHHPEDLQPTEVIERLREITNSKEMAEIAEPAVAGVFNDSADEIAGAGEIAAFSNEEVDKKKSGVLGALSKTYVRVSAFVAAVSTIATALVNEQAAAVLIANVQKILDLLVRIF